MKSGPGQANPAEAAVPGEPPVDVVCDNGPDAPDIVEVLVEPVHMDPAAARQAPPAGPPAWRSAQERERLCACEQAIGYTFTDKALLRNALTHSSSTADKRQDNERLEFFGDAVLDLVVREHLYHAYPTRQEGDLTEAKSAVVCRGSLVRAAKKLGLRECLQLGRGIGRKKSVPDSLLADAFEAVVAAMYLDGGYDRVRDFILATLGEAIPRAVAEANATNYKSTLQKVLQQQKRPLPIYRVTGASGPEHSRTFEVAVVVDGEEMGRGSGSNKKSAEQEAARAALDRLDETDDT